MKILIIFLAGFVSAAYLQPILDGLLQMVSNRITLDANKVQVKINEISGENQELSPQIGFQIDPEQELYDDEDDYEEDRIGFKK